jgi:prolipoprotein diacylglyceryl transferase
MLFASISWSPDPTIIDLFGFPVRWYGLFFASAFLAGFQIVSYMFKREGKSTDQADQLLMYTMVATIVGARAGHYFFYEFPLLQADPVRFFIQMITPPFSGLASHGAGIGLFTAFYLYARKNPGQSYLYITDRITPAVAFAGFCIRMGNLMNSEIIGKPTEMPWGFKFLKDSNDVINLITARGNKENHLTLLNTYVILKTRPLPHLYDIVDMSIQTFHKGFKTRKQYYISKEFVLKAPFHLEINI